MSNHKFETLKGIETMTLKEVNRYIFLYRQKIEDHKDLRIKYGGDYMWRDKQIYYNRKIDYFERSMYHLKIRRNILMNKVLYEIRLNQYNKRRDLLGPKRSRRT